MTSNILQKQHERLWQKETVAVTSIVKHHDLTHWFNRNHLSIGGSGERFGFAFRCGAV
jgi:hypothetical protein